MAKCKACGAPIIWIPLKSGKIMPCDNQRIPYKINLHDGKYTLVLPDGRVTRADLDLDSDDYGYVSHYETCPAADKFRRRSNG